MAGQLEYKLETSQGRMNAKREVMLARIKVIQARANANLAKAKVEARLKEMKEEMLAKMDANKKEMKEGDSEKFEIPRDTLVSWRDAYQEATQACLGKTGVTIKTGQEQTNTEFKTDLEDVGATDLEPNPEEKEAIVERQKVLNEEAAIHSTREWRK
jgi:ABC-type transporter MlaC component